MNRSDSITELITALAIAQGVIEGAAKDAANPFFKSTYADLASVWSAIRGPLSENGLAVMQLPSAEGPRVTITTILAHKSGEWISSELTLTAKEDTPQAIGSAITYARRYALQAAVGVAPEDDDGERAQGRQTQPERRPAPPPPRPQPIPRPQAQKEVLDRKLADIQQRQKSAPPPVGDRVVIISNGEFADADKEGKLKAFDVMRKALGQEQYSRILGAIGYTDAKEFRTLPEAKKAYQEMLLTLGEMNAARGTV